MQVMVVCEGVDDVDVMRYCEANIDITINIINIHTHPPITYIDLQDDDDEIVVRWGCNPKYHPNLIIIIDI